MLSEQLLSELHKLSQAEKLRVVQMLVNELAAQESGAAPALVAGAQYEVWSPYDAFAAAKTLQSMLDDYKRDHDRS